MASAFWTLKDGRGFASRWSRMAHMLQLLTEAMGKIQDADAFYEYLKKFVYDEAGGDMPNAYGGIIEVKKTSCSILI